MADTQLPQTRTYRKWTEEDLRAEAMRFETKAEFIRHGRRAYDMAVHRGILDDICSHMYSRLTFWTDEDIAREASKFESRWKFQRQSTNAYMVAQRRGILDQVCSHMPTRITAKSDSVYLWRPKNSAFVKIGVTSTHLGLIRMFQVADSIRVEPELIIKTTTLDDPRVVEKQILNFGIPVKFSHRFDGHTEFRWMGPEELSKAVQIIADNSWLN